MSTGEDWRLRWRVSNRTTRQCGIALPRWRRKRASSACEKRSRRKSSRPASKRPLAKLRPSGNSWQLPPRPLRTCRARQQNYKSSSTLAKKSSLCLKSTQLPRPQMAQLRQEASMPIAKGSSRSPWLIFAANSAMQRLRWSSRVPMSSSTKQLLRQMRTRSLSCKGHTISTRQRPILRWPRKT